MILMRNYGEPSLQINLVLGEASDDLKTHKAHATALDKAANDNVVWRELE